MEGKKKERIIINNELICWQLTRIYHYVIIIRRKIIKKKKERNLTKSKFYITQKRSDEEFRDVFSHKIESNFKEKKKKKTSNNCKKG